MGCSVGYCFFLISCLICQLESGCIHTRACHHPGWWTRPLRFFKTVRHSGYGSRGTIGFSTVTLPLFVLNWLVLSHRFMQTLLLGSPAIGTSLFIRKLWSLFHGLLHVWLVEVGDGWDMQGKAGACMGWRGPSWPQQFVAWWFYASFRNL